MKVRTYLKYVFLSVTECNKMSFKYMCIGIYWQQFDGMKLLKGISADIDITTLELFLENNNLNKVLYSLSTSISNYSTFKLPNN